jgi:TP901 family phage tail tape measure protein
MAFVAGAIIGKAILDASKWVTGGKNIQKTNNVVTGSIKALGKGMVMAGAAIGTGLTAAVIKANEFEKAFSNVRTLLDEGQVNTAKMKNELLGLDSRLGSAKNLTEGLYQALSAGVDASKAVDFVGTSAKFAKAALVDTNTAVDVITTSLNAYGMQANKASKISDILFKTIKFGKTTGAELSGTLGQVIPIAATLGVNMEELGASIATMTKQGINSAEATTQLQALMSAFLKPSKEMTAAFEEMGIASGSALLKSKGLTGALEFLQTATKGNKEALAAFLPNVRALKGAMALTGKQAENYKIALDEMKNSTGATDEAFQKQELTFETVKNSIEKVAIIIGQRLLPFVYDITNSFDDFITSGENMGKVMGTLEVGIALFNSAFKLVKKETLSILERLKTAITGAFGKKNISNIQLLAGAGKLVGITFKIVADVIWLVIQAIIDLVVAIQKSGKVVGNFFDFVTGKKKWKDIKESVGAAGEAFKNFGKNVKGNVTNLVDNAMKSFDKFPKQVEASAIILTQKWEKGVKAGGGLKKPVKEEVEEIVDIVGEGQEEINKESKSKWETFVENFKEGIKKGQSAIKGFFEGIGKKIIGNAQFVAGHVKDIYSSIFDLIMGIQQGELEALKAKNAEQLEEMTTAKDAELEAFDEQTQAEMDIIAAKEEQGVITEAEAEEQRKALEERRAEEKATLQKNLDNKIAEQKKKNTDKENEKEKKIFEAQKANKIAMVWINAAIGIMGAWSQSIAQLGPIAGAIFAGVLTAAILGVAIAQTVLISQQKFIPAKAEGGMAGGLTRVNEEGGEIITLPDGSQVIPNDISQQIARNAGGGNNIVMNVSFRGANIADNMSLRKITDYVSAELGRRLEVAL